MAAPERPRTEKRSELVARRIVQHIVDAELQGGARLPAEAQMASKLGVGRGTLREALRILEVHGLITIRPGPGGGPSVAAAGSRDFGRFATLFFHLRGATYRDLAEARYVLEPMAARLAAERQDRASISRLNDAIASAARFGTETDDRWTRGSTSFHDVVAGLTGNKILDLFGESIKDVWLERIVGLVFPEEARSRVHEQHEQIARAIADGDGDAAEEIMRAHMSEFLDYVAERYPGMLDEIVDWR